MGRRTDQELTVVVPGLTKDEARELRREMIDIKNRHAPHARGGIVIGPKDNFDKLTSKVLSFLRG